jgi:predicted amidophosphoribosyltransferase
MSERQIKASEIKQLREEQLKKQKSICPLCKTYIKQADAAYDHCHKTGHLRKVLHKNCNTVEGKISNWMRWVPWVDRIKFIKNLILYWRTDYSKNLIHHLHGKPKRRKRRRKK